MIHRHPSFAGRVGFARRDITPPVGIRHRNWGAQTHEVAEGIHRPLTATVLTLQTDASELPVVIAGLDLGWWRTPEDEWAVRGPVLKSLELPQDRLLICLSHTHAGPTTHLGDAAEPGGEHIPLYLAKVAEAIIEATRQALRNAEEAVLDIHHGDAILAFSRDVQEPGSDRYLVGYSIYDQPWQEALRVGRATTVDGKLIGLILSYPCHPTSLGPRNRLISPDYVGAAREIMEREMGVPCLFLQSWSGNLAPRDQYSGDPEVADRNGRKLGFTALALLEDMFPPAHGLVHQGVLESGAPLQILGHEPFNPRRDLTAIRLESDVNLKPMPPLRELDIAIQLTTEAFELERLKRQRQVRQSIGEDFRLPLWIVRAGELVFAGVPGELNWRYACRLDDENDFDGVFHLNVCNGWYGYLPEQDLYDRDQYTVWQSPFAQGTAEMVLKNFLHAITEDPESCP